MFGARVKSCELNANPKKYAGGQSCNMQKQESARSSTFHKLKSLEPCWVSTQPICSIRFIRFTTTHKGHASFSPGPNLPISFPRPLKPSDSSCRTLAAWMVVHESCWSIENQRVISVTPVFFPNPKTPQKKQENPSTPT